MTTISNNNNVQGGRGNDTQMQRWQRHDRVNDNATSKQPSRDSVSGFKESSGSESVKKTWSPGASIIEKAKAGAKAALKEHVRTNFEGSVEKAFDHYAGADKTVGADEVGRLLDDAKVKTPGGKQAWVDGIMAEVDSTGDGAITREEFQTFLNN